MATIALDTSSSPVVENWETNPDPNSSLPRAKVTFHGVTTIAILAAGNTLTATGTFLLPENFAYLPLDMRVLINGPSTTDLADYQPSMSYQFVVNGLVRKRGMMPNTLFMGGSATRSFLARDPANTNDVSAYYAPQVNDQVFKDLLVGGGNGNVVFSTIMINAVGDSPAGTITQEYSFLQYTVEQYRRAVVHSFAAVR